MLKKIMQKANAKKNQKGFTLIELLAVIVILAILAAIAIPSIISIINKQSEKADVQDAITIIHAAKLYVANKNITEDTTTDLGSTELDSYLDKVDSLPTGYGVKVDFTGTKAVYSIKDSSLPTDITSSGTTTTYYTEQQLLDYNK